MQNSKKGSLGEKLAVKYLLSKGFLILDRNIRLGKLAELDIVAKKDNLLHILEVKTIYQCEKLVDKLEFPLYNITPSKIKNLKLGTRIYLQQENLQAMDISIDAIGCIIDLCHQKSWLKYYPNILEGLD